MTGRMVQIDSKDGGRFEAYFAAPAGGKGPGLVILPEIYNSNHWVRAVADGFRAVPDFRYSEAMAMQLF